MSDEKVVNQYYAIYLIMKDVILAVDGHETENKSLKLKHQRMSTVHYVIQQYVDEHCLDIMNLKSVTT